MRLRISLLAHCVLQGSSMHFRILQVCFALPVPLPGCLALPAPVQPTSLSGLQRRRVAPLRASCAAAAGAGLSVDEALVAGGGWGASQRRLRLKLGAAYAYVGADNLLGVFLVEAIAARGWRGSVLSLPQEQAVKSFFFAGGCVGLLVAGPLADAFGRRPVLVWFTALRTFATLACFACPSLAPLLAARALAGAGCAGSFNVIFPLLAEQAPPGKRATLKRDLGLAWNGGVLALVGGAFLLRSRPPRALALLFLPSVAVSFALAGVAESPRFVAQAKGPGAALEPLRKIARANSVTTGSLFRDDAFIVPESAVDDARPCAGSGALFRGGRWRLSLALALLNFVASGTYYGLALAPRASSTAGVFATQALATALEVPALLVVAPLADRLGRRKAVSILFAACAFACAALAALASLDGAAPYAGAATLAALLLGRCTGQAAGTIKWVLNAEAFPTSCRITGLAFVGAAGQLGGWLAPMCFGVLPRPFLAFACALSAMPLLVFACVPETNGKPLR
ncbi:major facilitator superfamily domain-containing protein [Pelagophyceae sp. CCMP2097]|nr:major facilitator superfamily domain-containing protein [Pelagophyceae sp. CCMP2097]